MNKRFWAGVTAGAVAAVVWVRLMSLAFAGVSCSLPFALTNGQIADASQVMANYNAIITCLGNAASAGNNSDITSLSGLTTPLPPGEGGTPVYVGGTSTGAANAQIVGSVVPNSFVLNQNNVIVFTAGFTNTGATQINFGGTGLVNVFRMSPAGPQALTFGDIIAGNKVVAIYDGTQYQLLSDHNQRGGHGPQISISSASNTDLGSIGGHNALISGSATINTFGNTAQLSYPVYLIQFSGAATITFNQTNCATTGNCIFIPGGASRTTAVGDTAIALYLGNGSGGGGNWDIVAYFPAATGPSVLIVPPQGYLGLLSAGSGGPILGSADATGITTIFYTPYIGSLIPIYNGSAFGMLPFTELSCALSNVAQGANLIYDVFIFNNAGTLTCVFGPAWAVSTAGSGARGSGAGTTQITRINGIWVNANALTSANNGASTFTVPVNQGTYVGSIFVDATPGQVSGYRTWGSSRKFGVWNPYNRVQICLLAGDSTATWTYNSATIREARAQTTNTLAEFAGLAEEEVNTFYKEYIKSDGSSGAGAGATIGVGWNSTTAFSGTAAQAIYTGTLSAGTLAFDANNTITATYIAPPSLGVNNVNALESAANGFTGNGTQQNMVLSACWRG